MMDLLPCPFCGSTKTWPMTIEDGTRVVFIACPDCRSLGPTTTTKAAAIAAWNRRHAPATLATQSGRTGRGYDLQFNR